MAEKDQTQIQPSSAEERPHYSENDDEVSLKDLFLTLWSYRRAIVLLSMAVTILIIVIAGFYYLGQTTTRVAKQQFRLEFEGADKNQYPNGMGFSTSDILSMPVLDRVYTENKIDQYLEFHAFKASLTIIQTNDTLKLLEYEYATKLSETKLNVDQRVRLEAEFLEKKKNALVPLYSLMWDLGGDGQVASLPDDQVAKVFNDILRAWAEYADRVKGANQYQISLASRNILSKEDLEQEDYYIAMDMLRIALKRITNDIDKIESIPGSKTLKIGKNRISLSDLKYRLDDIENFKRSPLAGLIRQSGLTKDREFAAAYLQNRIFELNLRNEGITAKINVYEDSLSKYLQKSVGIVSSPDLESFRTSSLTPEARSRMPAMIPQFGASFLTSLMDMGKEQSDAKFRQDITQKVIDVGLKKVDIQGELKYYEKLYKQITEPRGDEVSADFINSATDRIKKTLKSVYEILMQTIEEIDTIYLELSKMNLNPDSILYKVTEPVIISAERPLSPGKLLMYMVLTWILAGGTIIFGVFIANAFTKPSEVGRREI